MTTDPAEAAVPRRALWAVGVTAAVVVATMVLLVWWVLARSQPTPWAELETEGNELVVHYIGGECDRSASLEVEESPEEVVVTVRVVGWALSCSDVGVPRTLRTTLDAPVGERTLVDGACQEARYAQYIACSGK